MHLFKYIKNKSFSSHRKKCSFLFQLLLSIYIIFSYNYENFCLSCINERKTKKCLNCRNYVIFRRITVFDEDETLNEIIYKNKSISRFGDGEFFAIFGSNLGFQKSNKELSRRLLEVLNSKEKNLLIGINLPYKLRNLNRFNKKAKKYFELFFKLNRFKLGKILKNNEYYSATITRFYIDYKSKRKVPKYIKKLKMIWNKREVVIVEGEKSRLGIGNDLFDNVNSIQRIICPIRDAFI